MQSEEIKAAQLRNKMETKYKEIAGTQSTEEVKNYNL